MALHYRLFKHAHDAPFAGEEDTSYIFKLVNTAESSPAAILHELSQLLQRGCAILESTFGERRRWPAQYRRLYHESIVQMIGCIWRRFILFYERWPWPLARLADPTATAHEKQTIAQQLIDADESVLDPLSSKLRRRVGTASTLLSEYWTSFLFQMFNTCVVATSLVESTFAQFKQWMRPTYRPMGIALLAAKHVTDRLARCCASKRDRSRPAEPARRTKPGRPEWVIKTNEHARSNGRSMYIGECVKKRPLGQDKQTAFKLAQKSWNTLPRADKQRYREKARAHNALVSQLKTTALEEMNTIRFTAPSTFGVADGDPRFPLTPACIDAAMREKNCVVGKSGAWAAAMGARVPESAEIPAQVIYPTQAAPEVAKLSAKQREVATQTLQVFGGMSFGAPNAVAACRPARGG